MSGFDTSQPIADEKSLAEGDVDEKALKADEPGSSKEAESVEADELGDATPGPR